MQALFYIALFGSFFFVVSSITVGVSMSTMQDMVDQRVQVEKMFRDVDFAINRIILREAPSLEMFLGENQTPDGRISDANVVFTAGDISWSPAQLQTDPWRSDIQAIRIREQEVLDGGGVQADVNYFVLASPGLDRNMETNLENLNNAADWRSLRSAGAEGDDIIHTFSTRDALLGIWNQAAAVEQNIKRTAVNRYQQKVKEFNNASQGAPEALTTCAIFNQTDSVGDINCTPFTNGLIKECFKAYESQLGGGARPGEDQGQDFPQEEIPDFTEEEFQEFDYLPGLETPVNECWKYDPSLRSDPDFPAMAGSMELYNDSIPDDQAIANELGIATQLDNDPFTNEPGALGVITFEMGNHPHELILVRSGSDIVPGWNFNRQVSITP